MTDYTLEDTIYKKFTTRAFSTGIPFTLAGTPVVAAYEDASVTQITDGITLTVDFDSTTGLNHLAIVATAANGFENGKDYSLVITAGTVDGTSVVGEVVGEFSIGRSAAAVDLANGTDGLTALAALLATTDGVADAIKVVTDQMVFTTANQLDTQTISMATNSMTADAAAADFIGAAEIAASAGTEIADLIAADWIAGDASPLAIVAALKADAEWSNLATLSTAVATAQTDLDTLTDARGEPGQGTPGVSETPLTKLDYLYKAWRNEMRQTATTYSLYNDAGTVVDQKATVADDGTTFTRNEVETGP